MKRKETVSVTIEDIRDCIFKKIAEKYGLDKQPDIVELRLASNIKFIMFQVIRKVDIEEETDENKKFIAEMKEKGWTFGKST